MLGEKLGESAGKITGVRVLSAAGPDTRLEASFQVRGTLLGVGITDFGTYEQVARPDGTLAGQGNAVMMTDEGEQLPWIGGGIGRPTGPGFAASFGVYGAFQQVGSAKLARLNRVATVIEYEIAEDGSYRWTCWEWTGAAGR